jgi:hypothetical protein
MCAYLFIYLENVIPNISKELFLFLQQNIIFPLPCRATGCRLDCSVSIQSKVLGVYCCTERVPSCRIGGAWIWWLISIWCEVLECMELFPHAPILFHDVAVSNLKRCFDPCRGRLWCLCRYEMQVSVDVCVLVWTKRRKFGFQFTSSAFLPYSEIFTRWSSLFLFDRWWNCISAPVPPLRLAVGVLFVSTSRDRQATTAAFTLSNK